MGNQRSAEVNRGRVNGLGKGPGSDLESLAPQTARIRRRPAQYEKILDEEPSGLGLGSSCYHLCFFVTLTKYDLPNKVIEEKIRE